VAITAWHRSRRYSARAVVRRPWVAARVLAFLALSVAWAPAGQAGGPAITVVKTPSGLEAWLVEDHSIPVVALSFAFRGGAALDPPDRLGLADMASNLLGEGGGELDSKAFKERVEDIAARIGFYAGRDSFGGALKTLSAHRVDAFELLRRALTAPRFDPEPVERVRAAMLAVLARAEEEPDEIAEKTWWARAFPDHPYGRPPDGTAESIGAVTVEDLRRFVAVRLARDNLVLGVVGDIGPEELRALLARAFDALPGSAARAEPPEARIKAEGDLVVVSKGIPQSVVVFGHAGPKRDDPDFYPLFVANHILGGGSFSSRLYKEVREKRGLAYSVYTYLDTLDHAGLVLGSVATENARLKDSVEIIRTEWRRLAEEGPTETELEEAKAYLTGSYALRFDSTDKVARMLVATQFDRLGIDFFERRNGLIEGVTHEDVVRAARRWLDPRALSFVVVGQPEGLEPGQGPCGAGAEAC